jgi:predicted DNA-binding mobile mystery protein A
MRNPKLLLVRQLDKKLHNFTYVENIQTPENGWINNIRTVLNMTLLQLSSKLNMTQQGVKKMEEREASESITLGSLREIGNALDLKLVYGFVPKDGSLETLISVKANTIAKKIVLKTSHNMKLENQGNEDEVIQKAIEDLAYDIKKELRKSLWD